MASQVDIINMALSNIGKASIVSIDEKSEPARQAKLFWDPSREAVLCDYDWVFARKVAGLTLSALDSVPNYSFTYILPPDCLMPRKVFNHSSDSPCYDVDDFSQGENKFEYMQSSAGNSLIIATNIEDAYLKYTADVYMVSMFDEAFAEALTYKLASKLAQPLTGDRNLKNDMIQLYLSAIDTAKRNNNLKQDSKRENPDNSLYIRCR